MKKWIIGGLLLAALCAALPVSARALAVFDGEAVVRMELEEYLAGVVAAEMPAAYSPEALKAQAVASRTRAVAGGGCRTRADADICVESTCCQGYLDAKAQRARWGPDAGLYRAKIADAVRETEGVIMTYRGKPIEVLYHAVSGGRTENAEAVFLNALPYLRGVDSPGEEQATGYSSVTFVSDEALCMLFPEEAADGTVRLEVLERSESGRVVSLRVGRHEMSGRTFRAALSLPSTWFELRTAPGGISIAQRGHGHGVGMSQAGANAMAKQGAAYDEILLHYYTGVEFGTVYR